jgi:hypothetical protein
MDGAAPYITRKGNGAGPDLGLVSRCLLPIESIQDPGVGAIEHGICFMASPTNAVSNAQHIEVINIDVLDKRLTDDKIEWYCDWVKGGDPDRRIRVDEATPLDSFLETVKSLIKSKAAKERCLYKIGVLSILAHGYGHCEYTDAKAYRDAKESCTANQKGVKELHGGFGIEFCRDDIKLDTVEKFKALNGLFNSQEDVGIKLMGCGAAAESLFHIYSNSAQVERGFGQTLCKKLAEVTGTCVMASEDLQQAVIELDQKTYRWGSDVRTVPSCARFGDLTGQVWIFRPNGKKDKRNPLNSK